jgi:hypothetical protein
MRSQARECRKEPIAISGMIFVMYGNNVMGEIFSSPSVTLNGGVSSHIPRNICSRMGNVWWKNFELVKP